MSRLLVQTPFLQILRVRLGFAVNCSAPFCLFLMNVSSPGADMLFLPFGAVLRFDECLGSWPPFCSLLRNVSSLGADLVFLPFGCVLKFDECLSSWPQFCSLLMNVSAPGANSASAWATPGRVTGRGSACHPPRTPPSYSFAY